jgi:transcriptional regulator with XRE-family HTH domain
VFDDRLVNSSPEEIHRRSRSCNPQLFKFLREKRGLTQSELARLAGFSERLIVKAEAGKQLSPKTIQVLAEVLGDGQQQLYPEDLTCDPVSLARQYTDALHQHQASLVDAIRHFLDDDVVFRIAGDPAVIPFAGEHRGIDAIDRGFKLFFSVLEVPEGLDYKPDYHYLSQGNDVVVWGKSWIHPRGAPLTRPMSISNLLRFRRGKLVLFEDNYDTHWAAQVVSEQQS